MVAIAMADESSRGKDKGEEKLEAVERAAERLREGMEDGPALELLAEAVKGLEEAGDRLEEEGG